jgi:hypothetical protein
MLSSIFVSAVLLCCLAFPLTRLVASLTSFNESKAFISVLSNNTLRIQPPPGGIVSIANFSELSSLLVRVTTTESNLSSANSALSSAKSELYSTKSELYSTKSELSLTNSILSSALSRISALEDAAIKATTTPAPTTSSSSTTTTGEFVSSGLLLFLFD